MKKIALFVLVIGSLGSGSCKKERSCTCITSYGSYTETKVIKAKSSKKDAENWCAANQTATNTNSGNANTVVMPTPTCKLD